MKQHYPPMQNCCCLGGPTDQMMSLDIDVQVLQFQLLMCGMCIDQKVTIRKRTPDADVQVSHSWMLEINLLTILVCQVLCIATEVRSHVQAQVG